MTVWRRSSVCIPITAPLLPPQTSLFHTTQRVQPWSVLPFLSSASSPPLPATKPDRREPYRFSPSLFFASSFSLSSSALFFAYPFSSCKHAIRGMHRGVPPTLSSPRGEDNRKKRSGGRAVCFFSSSILPRPSFPSLRHPVSARAFSVKHLFTGKANQTSGPESSSCSGASSSSHATTTSIPTSHGDTHEKTRDASLLQEDALATLQDRLLDTCVQILEMCGGYADGRPPRSEIDNLSRDVLFDLVDAVLHDYKKTPADQFELLYAAFCLPAAQKYAFLRTPLMTILECVTPPPFCQYLRGVDVFLPDFDEESIIRRRALLRFARVLMGDLEYLQLVGVVEAEKEWDDASGSTVGKERSDTDHLSSTPPLTKKEAERWKVEREEVVVHAIVQDFKKCFPHATRGQAFLMLERRALDIALQSKLYALLGQLCVELDREQTGKVSLSELEATARRVLGKEKAASLLHGAEEAVDSNGKLRYRQLCALLSRPPPSPSKMEAAATTPPLMSSAASSSSSSSPLPSRA